MIISIAEVKKLMFVHETCSVECEILLTLNGSHLGYVVDHQPTFRLWKVSVVVGVVMNTVYESMLYVSNIYTLLSYKDKYFFLQLSKSKFTVKETFYLQ